MRVLITGIAGFAGSALAPLLLAKPDAEVHGVIHRHDWRIRAISGQLHLHRGDLRNPSWVDELMQQVQPDYLLHLAAWSDVGGSWSQPWVAYELNIHCQLNLLEAVRRYTPACRVLVVGSNEVYGRVRPEELPVNEDTPFRPNSPYGVSKIAQDMMGYQYFCNYSLPIVRVRSFNHLGPGQSDDFVASAFARQIAEIEAGQREPVLRVGNLESVRDFTDVRDVVAAYWLAIQRGEPGAVYNVGSGRGYSIQTVLDTLLAMSDAPIRIEQDPTRLRPSDVPVMICDNRRLVEVTGWQPNIELRHTLQDVLNGWRQDIRGNRPPVAGVSD
ncbi:MAG: GDP-mannose 4,6-dehydratase [Caldilineaceae bacterium]|nr:GDP-mannose 4,6-dehydratase [Caldilineaceae bacterium]